jgi:hypothetical protein
MNCFYFEVQVFVSWDMWLHYWVLGSDMWLHYWLLGSVMWLHYWLLGSVPFLTILEIIMVSSKGVKNIKITSLIFHDSHSATTDRTDRRFEC